MATLFGLLFCGLQTDDQVAQNGDGRTKRLSLHLTKGKHVGGCVFLPKVLIQNLNVLVIGQHDGHPWSNLSNNSSAVLAKDSTSPASSIHRAAGPSTVTSTATLFRPLGSGSR